MSRILGLAVFSTLLTALAFIVLRGLWPALRTRRGAGAFWATTAVVHLAFLGGWFLHTRSGGALGMVTRGALTAWSVAALVSVVAGSLLRLAGAANARLRLARAPAPAEPVDPQRRQFLYGLAVPAAAATVGAGGTVAGMSGFEVRHEEVRLRGLPPALDGFRIGQLTDVHVGEFIDVEYVRGAVRALDAAGVDLQVMTGDLIDDLTQLDATLEAGAPCAWWAWTTPWARVAGGRRRCGPRPSGPGPACVRTRRCSASPTTRTSSHWPPSAARG
jgi:hypothetical protein